MRRLAALAAAAACLSGTADAQSWEVEARATVAAAAMDADDDAFPADDGPLFDASLLAVQTTDLDNGLRLEWRGEVRVQKDADGRPAFTGVLGDCPPAASGCPSLAGPAPRAPVAPATGLSVSGGPVSEAVFVGVEAASLSVSGPWGEGVVGMDAGAAARLDARAPQALKAVSAFSPSLDPSGLVAVRARNDVTGASFKASYLSPRWLGFRLGGSWTPEVHGRTADFDPDPTTPGASGAELENVFEGAVSFARQFASAGLGVRAALTATTAESGAGRPEFNRYEAWGAGLELERGSLSAGVRWLASNNAWRPGGGGYEALEAGIAHELGPWRFGVEAGWAEDELLRLDTNSWLVAARRTFGERFEVGGGYLAADVDAPFSAAGGSPPDTPIRGEGFFVEMSVRNW